MHPNFYIELAVAGFWAVVLGAVTRKWWIAFIVAFMVALGMRVGVIAFKFLFAGSISGLGWLFVASALALYPHAFVAALCAFIGTRIARLRSSKPSTAAANEQH